MRSVFDRARLVFVLRHGGMAAVVLVLTMFASALVPAAYAQVLSALVSGLREAVTARHAAATGPLLAFGALLIASELATTGSVGLTTLVSSRIDGANRAAVTALTTHCDVTLLERPEIRASVRDALADRGKGYDSTLSDGAIAQLRSVASAAGLLAACVVLTGYTLWLPIIVLAPALLTRILRTRQDFSLMQEWRSATGNELTVDIWRKANLSPAEGKDIRIFGLADWMVARMRTHIRDGNSTLWGKEDRTIINLWRQSALVLVGLAPAFLIVSGAAAAGRTTEAVATAVFTGSWAIFQVLNVQTNSYQIAGGMRALTAAARLREQLPAAHAEAAGGAEAADRRTPLIRFEEVVFAYPGGGRDVLQGVDLEIRPGELLAVVGLNGAGKTTLMTLLAGLIQPTSGRITIDAVPLASVDPALWWRQISIVFQGFVRYPLTLAENINLGSAGGRKDQDRLDAAARLSGLDEIVAELPLGWQTPLSRTRTGGVDLSGGQWQHVVLTRVLYDLLGGASLLVLDEPTAHLDVASEFAVFERLAACRGQASVLLISHRLSTVRRADRIAVLDGGRIAEVGSHDDLMELGGVYAELFAAQAERFQLDREEHGCDGSVDPTAAAFVGERS